MNSTAVLLVLASTATHAYWNFLIKRSAGGNTFIGLSKVAEAIVFAPVFLIWWMIVKPDMTGALVPVIGGTVLSLANYFALAKAYEHGDLSVVYPVARGGTLLFLPLLGYLVFGERISPLGWFAIACVMTGIAVINLRALDRGALVAFGRVLRTPAIGFALLASMTTAGYTVWDKRAVQLLPAFGYFYGYSAVAGVLYGGWLMHQRPAAVVRDEWARHRWPIVQVGVLNTLSYLLVLFALRSGTSSYVLALRQMSIGIGVFLGWRLLGEPLGLPNQLGVALLMLGCALVAYAG